MHYHIGLEGLSEMEVPHRLNISAALCAGTPVSDAAQAEGMVAIQQAEFALRGFRL